MIRVPPGSRFRALQAAFAALAGVVVVVGLLGVGPAQAHQPGATIVTVVALPDTVDGAAAVRLTGAIPLGRLDFAYDTGLVSADPRAVLEENRAELTELVGRRVALTDPDGTPWTVRVDSLKISTLRGRAVLETVVKAVSTGATAGSTGQDRPVDLRWAVVTDRVFSHRVFVGGEDSARTTHYLGEITHDQATLRMEVTPAGTGSGTGARASSLLGVGLDHFREGTDHLLFLCMIALGAARRRDGLRRSVRRLAAMTLMFSVGHSLSLALAATGLLVLPSSWVETGIALTIVVAAVHAVRPMWSTRAEVPLVGSFGLVHGFGFAGTLADLDISGTDLVVPLLSFNVGLEAAQLAALALVVLPLYVLARSRTATLLLAASAAAVAAVWVVQRIFSSTDPLASIVATVAGSPERLALLLLLAALVRLAIGRSRPCGPVSPALDHRARSGPRDPEPEPGVLLRREEATATVAISTPLPAGADQVDLTVTTAHGVGPTSTITLPVQR